MFDRKFAGRDRTHGKASRRHCFHCGKQHAGAETDDGTIRKAIAYKLWRMVDPNAAMEAA